MSERLVSEWVSIRRASTALYWWWRGADMSDGGRFHRWVWGWEDKPMAVR